MSQGGEEHEHEEEASAGFQSNSGEWCDGLIGMTLTELYCSRDIYECVIHLLC
jgi:hypothetical protein